MHLWGLHVVDLAIIVVFLVVVVWLGKKVGVQSKNLDDFFLAGRKLGKVYQFFLNFGSLDQRRPGRRGVARGVPPGHRRDVDPVARAVPHAVLLVHACCSSGACA